MRKKLGFFLFAIGMSASYAMANAGSSDPECYGNCNIAMDECVFEYPGSAHVCATFWRTCTARCDQAGG